MRTNVKNTLIIALLYTIWACPAHAFDIDMTVDDEIRKNFNPNQLVKDTGIDEIIDDTALEKKMEAQVKQIDSNLPALPKIDGSITTSKPDVNEDKIVPITSYEKYVPGNKRIRAGSSFEVISNSAISDWQKKGTKVTFKTTKQIWGKRFTIPANTVFYGEIEDSHQPQITCNGGLVSIKIYYMIYKNQRVPIDAYIVKADGKKIFLNNIKGDRTYLKTVWKKGNWGRSLFNQMLGVSVGLGATGATLVLTPFPFAYGTICLGASAITSPITAFFSKGGHVSIPAGSKFKIKLIEDVMVN